MILDIGPENLITRFEFNIPDVEKVGIFFSGGLDSLALLSLIIIELKSKKSNIPCIAFTVEKPTMEPIYADRLLKLVINHFKFNIDHINYIPNQEPYTSLGRIYPFFSFSIYQQYNQKILLYSASNNMPPEDIKKFNGGLGFIYKEQEYIKMPFINLYKPQIIDILYKLDIDYLIPYTHSCAKIPVGRCNQCYSCEERKWGFDALKLDDQETFTFNDI